MLLLDTHILVWLVARDKRLTQQQIDAVTDPDNLLFVSAVIAYEYTHLHNSDRLPIEETLTDLQRILGFEIINLPANSWQAIDTMPMIHRDPIDRMLIGHALTEDMTVITADHHIKQYPVQVI
ncbi:type II toxin-antitoxin system VapC family toxin [Alterisphingorhabdus coralli]|uniref:Type II toxin-antitoxin system VapC family toxin n=1 Tax=Alterisphingorhabdus coralli TaxID=3071408 RepID=A0AA97F5M9_9SPHN|nr:type II toxin-antitoxin system VapC family toxin [Parasphingorhabdus sp. SCSIO 66989]WOE74413.1 type II toxin-antitoxin system VapC family toxin [Parasphingorhabdus sp. SCSIO 66989]